MGSADSVIRLIIAAVIVILFITNVIASTLGIILLIIAGILVLTSFISFCPIYYMLWVKTCPDKKA